MTKQNPDILCHSCKEFDYAMNRQNGVSLDIWVVCECDELNPKPIKQEKENEST